MNTPHHNFARRSEAAGSEVARWRIPAGILASLLVLLVLTPTVSALSTAGTLSGEKKEEAGSTKMVDDDSVAYAEDFHELPPPPTESTDSFFRSIGAGKDSIACVPANQKRFEVIVARPFDRPDRSSVRLDEQRQAMYQASAYLNYEAKRLKAGAQARYRVLCDSSGEMVVKSAQLPTSMLADSLGTIEQDLKDLGYNDRLQKYVIFYDDCTGVIAGLTSPACVGGGRSTFRRDDRGNASNRNNDGLTYAIHVAGAAFPNPDWYVTLHESAHSMGAVQLSAPHSTPFGHCTDGSDIMCYNDSSVEPDQYDGTVCSTVPGAYEPTGLVFHAEARFDCNGDDYFNPDPPANSYLDEKWNLGAEYNHFLQIR